MLEKRAGYAKQKPRLLIASLNPILNIFLHILQLVFINLPGRCFSHGTAAAGSGLDLARLDFLHHCTGLVLPFDVLCASSCQVKIVEICLVLCFLVCMLLIECGTETAMG